MKCPICKGETDQNAKFCVKCGKRIPRCPTCGRVVETRAKYCVGDGTPLPADVLALLPAEPAVKKPAAAPAQTPRGESAGRTGSAGQVRTPSEKPAAPRQRFCTQCGKPCEPGQALCANCRPRQKPAEGAQAPRRSYCIKCGRPCSDGRTICVECRSKERSANRENGTRQEKRGGGTVILAAVVVLLLLALIGVALYFVLGGDGKKPEEPVSTEAALRADDNAGDWDIPWQADEAEDVPFAEAVIVPQPTVIETEPVVETEAIVETSAPTEPTEPPVDEDSVEYRLDYFINHCDSEYFSQSYFDGFDAEDCRLARNAVYAKSGRKFNDASLQAYYEQFSWYYPSVDPGSFSASMLNDCQLANVNAVLNYEGAHGYN